VSDITFEREIEISFSGFEVSQTVPPRSFDKGIFQRE
jgi:hypothetical protein